MIIALDYDHTFTEDPQVWYNAMMIMKQAGHTVVGVTMRYPAEASGMDMRYDHVCSKIFFTGRRGKKQFMNEQGLNVDVWIDDQPMWILGDAHA